jgi:AraC family transcriptional regulator of adaptative response / DNA-3-methyladenine glycosylase II
MASAAAQPSPPPDGLRPERCYRALVSRDSRFDGRFFVGVRTTGVYCRPICPARTPLRRNVRFFTCAAAAEEAGFRPCRRCRPETAPGTPAWVGSSATVTRALRLIASGSLDSEGVDALAERLGVGARQVRRLFAEHLGASPLAVARTRRVHFARRLIDETELPMGQIALAAGFSSLRQFNHSIRGCFGRPPSALRSAARGKGLRATSGELTLRVSYRPPLDWRTLLGFLSLRAIPGVEQIDADAYERSFSLGGKPTRIRVSAPEGSQHLVVQLRAAGDAALMPVVDRVRHLFDLCADPHRIATDLGRDRTLARCIAALPGLRVPGAWDGYELAVRAILGQQVTVKGASTLAGRLVERWGVRLPQEGEGPTHLFPRPEALAEADVASIGLPAARARCLRALSQAVASGELALEPGAALEETRAKLLSIPGVGDWTAQVIAMRALHDPDALPSGDLGLRRALGRRGSPLDARSLARRAERWRPWRAYAALWLWCAPPTR